MHHCLFVSEILEAIVTFLDEMRTSPSRKDILAFVLTCHTFREPGLDILWRELENPGPLAFAFLPNVEPIFPSDYDDEEIEMEHKKDPPHSTTVIGLSKVPTIADWEQFRRYSKRVRVLRDYDYHNAVHTQFLIDLLAYRPPGVPLLPNLRKLKWKDYQGRLRFPTLSLFLSPTLTTVCVFVGCNMNAVKLWGLLQSTTPALRRVVVTVHDFIPSEMNRMGFSQALRSWQDLTILEIRDFNYWGTQTCFSQPISTDDLTLLSQRPKLCRLRVAVADDVAPLNPSPIQENYFASLQDLTITTKNVPLITQIIKAVHPRGLRSIVLRCWLTYSPAELSDFLQAIAMHRQLNSLEINIVERHNPNTKRDDLFITGETLTPTFALAELTQLNIEAFGVNLTAESLEKMARSWPKITDLRLTSTSKQATTLIEASDLEVFTLYCPLMETLSIPVRKV